MNEITGHVFDIATENSPVAGCTVSRPVWEATGNGLSYFSLGAGTDISAELYDYHRLEFVVAGEAQLTGAVPATVGVGQAFAVAPGISRSGTTIATGLMAGVDRSRMAQFSFLMVLAPIIGEQSLDLLKVATGHASFGDGVGPVALLLGFVAAFAAGLFACRAMIALVKKARLSWFSLYCLAVALLLFILS